MSKTKNISKNKIRMVIKTFKDNPQGLFAFEAKAILGFPPASYIDKLKYGGYLEQKGGKYFLINEKEYKYQKERFDLHPRCRDCMGYIYHVISRVKVTVNMEPYKVGAYYCGTCLMITETKTGRIFKEYSIDTPRVLFRCEDGHRTIIVYARDSRLKDKKVKLHTRYCNKCHVLVEVKK